MKQAMWASLNHPLPWWIYPGIVASAVAGNLLELGLSPATMRGGLVAGVLVLVGLCTVRRALVGHWK